MRPQGDQVGPKTPKLTTNDAQSRPRPPLRQFEGPKVSKSHPPNGSKSAPKWSKIGGKTSLELRTIFETTFWSQILKIDWIFQTQTFENHSKNCGFRRFFDFRRVLPGRWFLVDFWLISRFQMGLNLNRISPKSVQHRSWNLEGNLGHSIQKFFKLLGLPGGTRGAYKQSLTWVQLE